MLPVCLSLLSPHICSTLFSDFLFTNSSVNVFLISVGTGCCRDMRDEIAILVLFPYYY